MKYVMTETDRISFIIDDEDFEKVSNRKWFINNRGYVLTNVNCKTVMLSRFLLDYDDRFQVDHINENKLDNQKFNLQILSASDNCAKRKSFIGSTGLKCVVRKKNFFYASLKVRNKMKYGPGRKYKVQSAIDAQNIIEIYRPYSGIDLFTPSILCK